MGSSWIYTTGGTDSIWVDELPHVKPKCECGTTVTLGKDDTPSAHSDYCPVKKDYNETKKLEEALNASKT